MAVDNASLYEKAEESAATAERNRLARDLHDAVSQTLFSASLIAEVLPGPVQNGPRRRRRRRLDELRQLTRGALAEMRTLLLELRPAALAEADLPDLLRQLARGDHGARAGAGGSRTAGRATALTPDVQLGLYRIAQEALNNVAKHSGAAGARVTLSCEDGGARRVLLTVEDDGHGFDPTGVSGNHLGLNIMSERAEAIGATLEVRSRKGEGTRVSVEWASPGPAEPA